MSTALCWLDYMRQLEILKTAANCRVCPNSPAVEFRLYGPRGACGSRGNWPLKNPGYCCVLLQMTCYFLNKEYWMSRLAFDEGLPCGCKRGELLTSKSQSELAPLDHGIVPSKMSSRGERIREGSGLIKGIMTWHTILR